MIKSKLTGKVAIITGSSMGIGKAVAIALAQRNVSVVLNGRNQDKLDQVREALSQLGLQCIAIKADVANYKDCEKLITETIAHYGRLDILVNNAGISMEGTVEETAPEVFEKVFKTNILGVIYPTKAAIPYIKKTDGSIVFTSSIAGQLGLPEYSAYSASKMALTALSQSLRIELAKSGVHIGINYVGFTENDAEKTFINKLGELEKMPVRQQFKRMAVEEVANYIVKGIERRRKKQTLTSLGRLTVLVQRLFPGILEWGMTKRYTKQSSSKQ